MGEAGAFQGCLASRASKLRKTSQVSDDGVMAALFAFVAAS